MDKKVSVIIPCFNQGKYIEDAVKSVLNQTYNNIEIVIINDCSTDNSIDKIKYLKEKYPQIVFINNKKNEGVVYSRNIGIEKSSGEYILPLDADDTIEPTYIEKAVNILSNNPNIGLVYCKKRTFGCINKNSKLPVYNEIKFLISNCIFCSALFRKSDFIKAGKYNPNMKYGLEDWDLWLSFIELNIKPYRIDEILFNCRKYKEESRSNVYAKNKEETYKTLIFNHKDLYLSKFSELMKFSSKKYKKFKTFFYILLIFSILEFLVIIYLILFIKNFN